MNERSKGSDLPESGGHRVKASFNPHASGPIFTIDTPPPTVSGELHIGHCYSFTQTDVLARYHRMRGERVFYPMGFDDNGLPTERFAEKTIQRKERAMERHEFIKLCLELIAQYDSILFSAIIHLSNLL
jgi:valyl-tRNA synthetase